MATTPGQHAPRWWEPVFELVIHVLVGSGLFAIIFAPAVGLDLAVTWMKTSWEISEFLATLLTVTKYTIAVIDAFLYIVFMLRMGWLFVTKLLGGTPHHDQPQKTP